MCPHDCMRFVAVHVQARVRWLQVLRAAQKPAGGGWDLDFDADCECCGGGCTCT
jgi:hypothetical protein